MTSSTGYENDRKLEKVSCILRSLTRVLFPIFGLIWYNVNLMLPRDKHWINFFVIVVDVVCIWSLMSVSHEVINLILQMKKSLKLVESQIGCALPVANFSFCQSSGPMVQHYCHGITISIQPKHVKNLFKLKKKTPTCHIYNLKQASAVGKWLFHDNTVGP